MQIIAHGYCHSNPLPQVTYTCKCRKCGCIFTFNNHECNYDYGKVEASTRRPAMYIECPECNKINYEWHWDNNI